MTLPPIGLPYARAEVTPDGGYGVRCPVCNTLCMQPPTARTEDAATKGAGRVYAEHYTREHAEA